MAIRAVSFDVGATLLRPYPSFAEIVLRCCREAGSPLPDCAGAEADAYADRFFGALQRRGETYSDSEERSRQIWTDLYHGFLLTQGIAPELAGPLALQLFATFIDHASYRLYDDALPTLEAVRARGYRIGIISNWESWLVGLLRSVGVEPYAEFQAISGIIGHEKPSRVIFDHAVVAAGVRHGEILHVGDSLTSDYEGATAAGLRAVLLDRDGRHADAAVPRITALPHLLDRLDP